MGASTQRARWRAARWGGGLSLFRLDQNSTVLNRGACLCFSSAREPMSYKRREEKARAVSLIRIKRYLPAGVIANILHRPSDGTHTGHSSLSRTPATPRPLLWPQPGRSIGVRAPHDNRLHPGGLGVLSDELNEPIEDTGT